MSKEPDVPVYLTVVEVAELLRVCRTTVYTLIGRSRANPSDRGIPVAKVGGSYRIRRSDLDEWLATDRSNPGTVVPKRRHRGERAA